MPWGESGECLGQIEVGWTAPTGFLGLEVTGDKGTITVDYRTGKATMVRGVTRPDGTATTEETVLCDGAKVGSWPAEMIHFTSKLGGRAPYSPGLDAGIASLQIALAAYRSQKTGKRISL